MNSYERKRRICKVIVLVLGILSLNNIILTIRNYSYAYFHKNVKSDIKLKITTLDEMPNKGELLIDKIKTKLTTSNSITDTDGTIYLSGSNDTINFNYVWYSGKLWRITAINPDNSIKMITQDCITAIYFGKDGIYKDSWIYQWLNEDFKDTLYNYQDIIVQNSSWNVTLDDGATPIKPPTDSSATIVRGDVGLLNAYEYYQSYKKTGYSNGYLNTKYNWSLLTPYSDSLVKYVANSGEILNGLARADGDGVRPVINLKTDIRIIAEGDGSETNPYQIIGDKEPGNSGELINTRLSGEYVKVDNKKYRIVGIDKDNKGNNITKLTSVDYVRDDGGKVLIKYFSSSNSITNYGTVVSKGNDSYWGYYLNNTWLTSELQQYITDGKYYLGKVGGVNNSYKNSICNTINTTEKISTCIKTSSTWEGLVGLPREGEMFSTMFDKKNTSAFMWLITPSYTTSFMRYVDEYSSIDDEAPTSHSLAARPSIYLKSEVIITGGDGMSETTAYTIGL